MYCFHIKKNISKAKIEAFIVDIFNKTKDQIGDLFEETALKRVIYYEYYTTQRGFSTYLSIHGGAIDDKMDITATEIYLARQLAKQFQTDVLIGIPDEINPYLWWLINAKEEIFLATELLSDDHYDEEIDDFIEIDYTNLQKLDNTKYA